MSEKKEQAVRTLGRWMWFGAAYLVGATAWLIANYIKGTLASPLTIIWLLGILCYVICMRSWATKARRIREGSMSVTEAGPDERSEIVAGSAAQFTVVAAVCALLGFIVIRWQYTAEFPVDLSVIMLITAAAYHFSYMYYDRRL